MSDSKKPTEGFLSKNASLASIALIFIGILAFIIGNEQVIELSKYLIIAGAAFGVADIFRNRNINITGSVKHDVNHSGKLNITVDGKLILKRTGPRDKHTGSTVDPPPGNRQKVIISFWVKCEEHTHQSQYFPVIESNLDNPLPSNVQIGEQVSFETNDQNVVVSIDFL